MIEPEPAIIHAARLLATRLERLSADSLWAHRASGVRGSLLRGLEDWETQQSSQPGTDSPILARLNQLNQLGFAILTHAAREIRPPRDR
jgi:hypothetical protein